MHTKLDWFEIPASNLDRAVGFYEAIFATTMKREDMGPSSMAIFMDAQGAGFGAIAQGPGFEPSHQGSLLYLNAGADIDVVLARVTEAGGSIHMDKLVLPDNIGTIATIIDSEGNRIGLHSEA